MIYGIGTDICDISRIERLYNKAKERFPRRLLTESEYRHFQASNNKVKLLAKRFAIKEAIAKALGTGIGAQLSFQDIEIQREHGQRPRVMLKKDTFKHLHIHISVSDEQHYALAYAIAEKR